MRDFAEVRLTSRANWLETADGANVAGVTDMDTPEGEYDAEGEARFTTQLVARWNACLDALDLLNGPAPQTPTRSYLVEVEAILRRAVHGEPAPSDRKAHDDA